MNWHHRVLCRKLDDLVSGRIKRLMVCMPPRHGKSEVVSRRFPAYILGRQPRAQIIACSYSADLASRMNRDVQRIMDSPEYARVFPETRLNAANVRTAAGGALRNSDIFEIPNHGGVYRSAGVGGGVTGMGATYAILDDPIKNREEADSATYRDKLWEWYCSTFLTRLEKGGCVLLVMCMVGETPVLMADGTERKLSAIRPGDEIATYKNGALSVSTVKHWTSQGPDFCFEIRTTSGIAVEANERHPFLVKRNGELKWVRLRDLRVSDRMMRAVARGRMSHVRPTAVASQSVARGCARRTTTSFAGHGERGLHPSILNRAELPGFATVMGSSRETTQQSLNARGGCARYAGSPQQAETRAPTGITSCALTTITKLEKTEGCSVTTATLPLDMGRAPAFSLPPLNTYEITEDEIVSIEPTGSKEVFDIEVAETENFIAGGLVSHNTRWHEDDIAGRLLKLAAADPAADQWDVVRFPAEAEGASIDDPRQPGDPLWPNKYDTEALGQIRAGIGSYQWASLYQQRPAPASGGIWKTRWWRFWCERGEVRPPVRIRLDDGETVECPVRQIPDAFDDEIQSWDMTFKGLETSKGGKPDYVVGGSLARSGADCYLRDVTRGQWEFFETIQQVVRFSEAWPETRAKLVEDKANGPAIISTLSHKIPGLIAVEPDGDKAARARAVAHMIEAGNVYLPHPDLAPWVWGFIHECSTFPSGEHDDQVDMLSQALRRWSTSTGASYDFSALNDTAAGLLPAASSGFSFGAWRR